jgi:hypothetical protein
MKKGEEQSLNIFWSIWHSYHSEITLPRSQRLPKMSVRDIE